MVDDTIRFTRPPRVVPQVLFKALAPGGRRRGLKGSDPDYLHRVTDVLDEAERLPSDIADMLISGLPRGTGGVPATVEGT